jgi:hypothetical protein
MRRGKPHALGLDPVQQRLAGPPRLLGLDVATRAPVGLADLGRVVGDIAPEQGRVTAGADQQALGAGGVPGRMHHRELGTQDVAAVQQLDHPERLQRADAPLEGLTVVVVALASEQLPFRPLDQVASPREPRPGLVAVPGQVPPTWSRCRWVRKTSSTSSGARPAAASSCGSRPAAPIQQPPAVGPAECLGIPSSVRLPRRPLDPGKARSSATGKSPTTSQIAVTCTAPIVTDSFTKLPPLTRSPGAGQTTRRLPIMGHVSCSRLWQ